MDAHDISQDLNLSQDQTFTSATDESQFHTNDCSLTEDLLKLNTTAAIGNESQVIETNSQSDNTTHVSLNQTHTSASNSALPPNDKQSVSPTEEYVPQTEESVERPVPPQESDDTTSEAETRSITTSTIKDSSSASNVDGDQLDVTAVISSDTSFASVATVNEEQTIESAETLSSEDFESCATHISAPSTSEVLLAQYAEDSYLLSNVSSPLENTNNKLKDNSAQDLSGPARNASTLAALSPTDDTDRRLLTQIIVNSSDAQAVKSEIGKEQGSPQLDKQENSIQLLSNTNITKSGTSEVEENLQINLDTQNLAVKNSATLSETQFFAPKENIVICNETQVVEQDPSETVIIQKDEDFVEDTALTVAKKEKSIDESLDRTLTLQEFDVDFATASNDEDQYLNFKPQRQSTTLTLPTEKSSFEEFKSTAEEVTNDLLNSSLELVEEANTFVSATSTSKCKFLFRNFLGRLA